MAMQSDLYDKQRWFKTLTGSKIRIRTPGTDTDNRLTVIEFLEPPDTNPPVFTRHEFIEVFCVISGTLTFQFIGEEKFHLTAGDSVTCQSFKPHSFWNDTSTPVTVLLFCTPAGLDQFFIESDALLTRYRNNTQSADYSAAMKRLRTKHGLEHVGEAPEKNI